MESNNNWEQQTLNRDERRATDAQVSKRSSITKGKKELQQALTRATNAPPKTKQKKYSTSDETFENKEERCTNQVQADKEPSLNMNVGRQQEP